MTRARYLSALLVIIVLLASWLAYAAPGQEPDLPHTMEEALERALYQAQKEYGDRVAFDSKEQGKLAREILWQLLIQPDCPPPQGSHRWHLAR